MNPVECGGRNDHTTVNDDQLPSIHRGTDIDTQDGDLVAEIPGDCNLPATGRKTQVFGAAQSGN